MMHAHVECVCELAVGVGEEIEHGALSVASNLLVVRPCVHDGPVVDAEDDNLVDPLGLQLVLSCEVSGDVLCGSCRRECAGQTHEDHLRSRGDAVS